MTAAEALQRILRYAAEWLGLNPDEVTVEANTNFEDDPVEGQALLNLMQAVQLGLPMSPQSIHRWLKQRDLTRMEYEEEEALAEEARDKLLSGVGAEGVLNGDPSTSGP